MKIQKTISITKDELSESLLELEHDELLTPQPEPKEQGQAVYIDLMKDLVDAQASYDLIELVKQRYEQGLEKYGQPLMSDDGRDTKADLVQEVIDSLYYCEKGIIQGEDWHTVFNQLCFVAEMLVEENRNV